LVRVNLSTLSIYLIILSKGIKIFTHLPNIKAKGKSFYACLFN